MPDPAPVDALRSFGTAAGVSLEETPNAVLLRLVRDEIRVTVTVPREVLEWFVEVADAMGIVASDWCDYAGYDDSPAGMLATNMAADIRGFLGELTARPLRVTRVPGASPRLEWRRETEWCCAVPFASESMGR